MVKGQAYINNVDASYYGATFIRGFYEALMTPAPIKQYIQNNSRLEHGVRVVATSTNTKLDKRDITLQVMIEGETQAAYLQNYENFLSAITQGVFQLRVPKLSNKTYKLVYTSCTKHGNYGLKKGIFALKLTEPNPSDRTTPVETTPTT